MTRSDFVHPISLKNVARSSLELERGQELILPASIVASNLAQTNPSFAKHMAEFVYTARIAQIDPISLVGLPPGTILYGGDHFVAACEGGYIEEQYPPYIGTLVPALADIIDVARPMIDVGGEHLLVGRFGFSTWGHWLGELLPKILLAERSFPGRFKYVLPDVFGRFQTDPVLNSISQSLVACGIGEERVFAARIDCNYAFGELFAVTPVWSSYVMHPAASEALRNAVAAIAPSRHDKLAIVRDARFGRSLQNHENIYGMLRKHGFRVCATGLMSFSEQVSAFKGAEMVFGVLGSDLTNLLFAPAGVHVVTAAPDVFGDRFFYALVLDRRGRMADMRGPVQGPEPVNQNSAFHIDLDALASALTAFPPRRE